MSLARSTTFTASSGLQLMTTRDCVSPNSKASSRRLEREAPASLELAELEHCAPIAERSIVAPMRRGVSRAINCEMQLSASATARPPSLQSCALFTRPDWIRPRSVECSVFATSRSQRGGEPFFWPWTTCRYALPPRPCNGVASTASPSRMMASPSSLNHCVVTCSSFSMRPTTEIVGVGSIGPAGL
jgi:hypothetical protein